MANFRYSAVTDSGQTVSGNIDASDRRSAVAALTDKGQFVTSLLDGEETSGKSHKASLSQFTPGKSGFYSSRITGKEILSFTGQLSTALRSGLPLMDCLSIIRQQSQKPAMKNLLSELIESVSSGDSLSDALGQHPKLFSPMYQAMVRVGETGGMLEQTMAQLTQLLGREEKVKSNIKTASAYPLFVLCLGIASLIVIVTWLLPKIIGTIGSDSLLPLPTRMLLWVSDFTKDYGLFVAIAIAVVIYSLKKWARTPKGKISWDSFKLKIPIWGPVLRSIAVGRFARTFGALTKGGVVILEALMVVRDTLGNEFLACQIDTVLERVRHGEPLAEPLAESGRFPPLLVQIISVGEQTGKLDELLLNAADTFDSEADAALDRFMALLPAVLVLILALLVGFIVVATLLPIVGMELGVGGM